MLLCYISLVSLCQGNGASPHEYTCFARKFTSFESWRIPFGEDIAIAMDYLHRIHEPKVIHRDLKPQNVLIDHGGRAHLADFGIARLSQNTFLNTANHAIGTLNYMAPELFGDGTEVDEKCDVYSFGMIAYEMFTAGGAHERSPPWARTLFFSFALCCFFNYLVCLSHNGVIQMSVGRSCPPT